MSIFDWGRRRVSIIFWRDAEWPEFQIDIVMHCYRKIYYSFKKIWGILCRQRNFILMFMLEMYFNQDSITRLIDRHTSHVKLNQHLIEFKVLMCGYKLNSEHLLWFTSKINIQSQAGSDRECLKVISMRMINCLIKLKFMIGTRAGSKMGADGLVGGGTKLNLLCRRN